MTSRTVESYPQARALEQKSANTKRAYVDAYVDRVTGDDGAGLVPVARVSSGSEEHRSLPAPPLRVMGQSYYVRPSATLLKATYSRLGVTAHQVLMGTGTDQVVALDKRFLDPRRPTKPSREDREEGLVPYAEVLPIAPKSWVTTKHQVARLRGIVTAPANLESTVLCVAHGPVSYTHLTLPTKA